MNLKKDWQVELIEAHPNLFHPPAGVPERAEGYPECGGGWHSLLESACSGIDSALGSPDTFRVGQIKKIRHPAPLLGWKDNVRTWETRFLDATFGTGLVMTVNVGGQSMPMRDFVTNFVRDTYAPATSPVEAALAKL